LHSIDDEMHQKHESVRIKVAARYLFKYHGQRSGEMMIG